MLLHSILVSGKSQFCSIRQNHRSKQGWMSPHLSFYWLTYWLVTLMGCFILIIIQIPSPAPGITLLCLLCFNCVKPRINHIPVQLYIPHPPISHPSSDEKFKISARIFPFQLHCRLCCSMPFKAGLCWNDNNKDLRAKEQGTQILWTHW